MSLSEATIILCLNVISTKATMTFDCQDVALSFISSENKHMYVSMNMFMYLLTKLFFCYFLKIVTWKFLILLNSSSFVTQSFKLSKVIYSFDNTGHWIITTNNLPLAIESLETELTNNLGASIQNKECKKKILKCCHDSWSYSRACLS